MTLHGQWHICQVRRKAQCNVSLTCLGSSLANCTGASVEVVKARCHTSLAICVCHLAHLRPDLYSKRQLHRNHNFGTAISENGLSLNGPNRDCAVKKGGICEVVGSHQFCQGDPGLCQASSAFWIVDLTSHVQRHIFRIGRVKCACLRAILVLHLQGLHTVEVVQARCHNSSYNLCLSFGPFETRSLQKRQLHRNHNFGTATSENGLSLNGPK